MLILNKEQSKKFREAYKKSCLDIEKILEAKKKALKGFSKNVK